ncbi:M20 family metallopeptidase [Streptomyces sp. NPDC017991]|uniref:M20 family metallopeptidase n=1 Tax=Streptomyces sp. NPDC017991 TaxID=3365026 RepID=UPI0037BC22EF
MSILGSRSASRDIDVDRALATVSAMVRQDTRTQTPQESSAVLWVRDQLDELKLDTYLVPAAGDRLNAVGIWRGSGGGPSLMFNGHVDTNPVTEGWTRDPWGGEVDDGHIYGLGVSNMKAGCAAYLEAIRALRDDGWRPSGDVILTFVVGELQNGIGTRAVLDAGHRADHFVNCEPTDLTALTTHAGAVMFRVQLVGSTRHMSKREESADALAAAGRLLPLINGMSFSGAADRDARGTNRAHIGSLRAGLGRGLLQTRPPQVADVAELQGSARFGPGQNAETVLAELREVTSQVCVNGIAGTVEQLTDGGPTLDQPFRADRDSLVVRAVNDAYGQLRGSTQPTGAIQPYCYYGSDASLLQHVGDMPGIVCGPGGKFNTMPDERVSVEDYLDAIRLYAMTTTRICG